MNNINVNLVIENQTYKKQFNLVVNKVISNYVLEIKPPIIKEYNIVMQDTETNIIRNKIKKLENDGVSTYRVLEEIVK